MNNSIKSLDSVVHIALDLAKLKKDLAEAYIGLLIVD